MKNFLSFYDQWVSLLSTIVSCDTLHAKWLNTLSYLENCGARKIAACEHPTLVKEEMLKHAAEEFRHAHYLKKQIARVSSVPLDNYSSSNLLGGLSSMHYLHALDIHTSRYLSKTRGLSKLATREAAYLLVTYGIELRAAELYQVYDRVLRQYNSKVTVKSILLEEHEHLKEMEEGLRALSFGSKMAEQVTAIEGHFCSKWLTNLIKELKPKCHL